MIDKTRQKSVPYIEAPEEIGEMANELTLGVGPQALEDWLSRPNSDPTNTEIVFLNGFQYGALQVFRVLEEAGIEFDFSQNQEPKPQDNPEQ